MQRDDDAAGDGVGIVNLIQNPARLAEQNFGTRLRSLLGDDSIPSRAACETVASREKANDLTAEVAPPSCDGNSGKRFSDFLGNSVATTRGSVTSKFPLPVLPAPLPATMAHGVAASLKGRSSPRTRETSRSTGDKELPEAPLTQEFVLNPSAEYVRFYVDQPIQQDQGANRASQAKPSRQDATSGPMETLDGISSRSRAETNHLESSHNPGRDSSLTHPSLTDSSLTNESNSNGKFLSAAPSIHSPQHNTAETSNGATPSASIVQRDGESIHSDLHPGTQTPANDRHCEESFHGTVQDSQKAEFRRHLEPVKGSGLRQGDRPPEHGKVSTRSFGETSAEPPIVRHSAYESESHEAGPARTVSLPISYPSQPDTRTQNREALSADHETRSLRPSFDELDRPASNAELHWIHARDNRAEAGFEDPSIGWVRVRAHVDASGVHASVIPGSTEAAEALGAHVSG